MPIIIEVNTFDPATDVVEQSKRIDHNNSRDRRWLGRHCFWALRNGKGVECSPVEE